MVFIPTPAFNNIMDFCDTREREQRNNLKRSLKTISKIGPVMELHWEQITYVADGDTQCLFDYVTEYHKTGELEDKIGEWLPLPQLEGDIRTRCYYCNEPTTKRYIHPAYGGECIFHKCDGCRCPHQQNE